MGASGSSTIRTSDFASPGTSLNSSGGFFPNPSQVYFDGIYELFSKAADDILIFPP